MIRSADVSFGGPQPNLDNRLRLKTCVEIRDLQQCLVITSIYVTYDLTEAMILADDFVVLNEDAVEQAGTPIDV